LEISLESVESHADTTQHTAEPYWGSPIERTWRTQQEGGIKVG
jgi:hypothetical protein